MNNLRNFVASAFAIIAGLASCGANASTVTYEFSGLDALSNSFTAEVTLDESGGFATGATGIINDAAFGGSQSLVLITSAISGSNYSGTIGFRANDGTDFYGFDNAVPISVNGLLFAIGSDPVTGPVRGQNALLGIYGDGSGGYQSGFFGHVGNGPNEYGYNMAVVVAAVPEPETYAMLVAGLGLVGGIARRRKATCR